MHETTSINTPRMSTAPANWLYHPYLGIDVITPPDLIGQPLFDSGTILSITDAAAFGCQFPFAEDAREIKEYETLLPVLGATGHDEITPTMLLARSYGPTNKEIEERALERVQELASALAIIFYARSDFREAPSLPEHTWSSGSHSHLLIGVEHGVKSYTDKQSARSAPLYIPDPAFVLTRDDLLCILRCQQFKAFSDLLLFPCDPDKKSFRSVVSGAARTLNRTINANAPEHQLLGAITVLEMLASKQQSSSQGRKTQKSDGADNAEIDVEPDEEQTPFKTIAARICALVGPSAYEHFQFDDTFRLRHGVVHRGWVIPWEEARHAGFIATLALLAYANAAQSFSKPSKLFSYLDFEAERQRLVNTYPQATASWSGPTTRGCFPDHVPFRLTRFGYSNSHRRREYTPDQKAQEVAEIVIAYAQKREIAIDAAWDSIRPAILGYPNPFNVAADVERYYSANTQAIDDGATELLDMFHKYQWKYD